MSSDPKVREELLENLKRCGGSVYGSTFGEVVRKVRPEGRTMNQAKLAMNSLAHPRSGKPQVSIRRTGNNLGIGGDFGGYHITSL